MELTRLELIQQMQGQGWTSDAVCAELQRRDTRLGGPTYLRAPRAGAYHAMTSTTLLPLDPQPDPVAMLTQLAALHQATRDAARPFLEALAVSERTNSHFSPSGDETAAPEPRPGVGDGCRLHVEARHFRTLREVLEAR